MQPHSDHYNYIVIVTTRLANINNEVILTPVSRHKVVLSLCPAEALARAVYYMHVGSKVTFCHRGTAGVGGKLDRRREKGEKKVAAQQAAVYNGPFGLGRSQAPADEQLSGCMPLRQIGVMTTSYANALIQ